MSEAQDPPLRLTIEGLRWMGDDEWNSTGTSATVDIHGTDTGDGAEILRLLRAHLARRLLRDAYWDTGNPTVPTPVAETIVALREWQPQAREALSYVPGQEPA